MEVISGVMSLKKYYYVFREKLCVLLHKDPMQFKLERYRLYGADIGENVRAFSPISSAESYLIKIGNNVTISTGVKFCTHDNSVIKIFDRGTDFVGPIIIGDNSFVGMNTIILGGCRFLNVV